MLERELQWEKNWFFCLNGSDSVFWDYFFYLYSYKWMWIPFYLCLLFAFIYKRKCKDILWTLFSVVLVIVLCDQIASGIFKPLFHRFRPTHHPDFQEQVKIVLGYTGGAYGFISSHAANAFGLATFTALLFRNRLFTGTIFLFALINAYSRIYLGVHFISDVLIGALAGIGVGYAVYSIYKWKKIQDAYPKWKINLLCLTYALSIIIVLLFNNQIIKIIVK